MNYQESALTFAAAGDQSAMFGVLSVPEQIHPRGVLIVVGGPQYRAGSHRQFTLLARSLAEQGIAALRFDYRGMGDSEGATRTFESVDADLNSAVGAFLGAVPEMREVVIWGLCDAASAALFYAAQDARVSGLVLLNPWVRTSGGLAKATLKHYYRQRLMDPDLWKKIFSGRFNAGAALGSFVRLVGAAVGGKANKPEAASPATAAPVASAPAPAPCGVALPERMLAGLNQFKGKVLLIMSGADLTAQEFGDVVKASKPWQKQLAQARVTRHALAPADHTFSRRVWRDQVAEWTGAWVKSW